jgi:bifunctional UDP-N-acetylglucosamine pyrophosphorylase / glucosamine-1-phosphate N-acetyltransferase
MKRRPSSKSKRSGSERAPPPVSVVILAAGQGKRMNSDLPKVLQPLAGKPLLQHVIATARSLAPAAVHVVHGHGGDRVLESLKNEPVSWIRQAEQLGTGHAMIQTVPQLEDEQLVLILYGDVPLIRAETLRQLVTLAGTNSVALLTVILDDPTGYGRIVRDAQGRVRRIVEQRDASRRELAIRECNTGVLAVPVRRLKSWLAALRNDNAQREYYLTDIIAMAVRERVRVEPLVAPTAAEVLGVNDKIQLAEVESAYRRQRAAELMRAGATVIDPGRIDIRGNVEIGRDVEFDVNVVLEGNVRLGDRVRIGANCVVRDSTIGADTRVFPNCVIDGAVIGASCNIGPFGRFRPSSTLADHVHIGNFVEVKNTKLGAGSKANHLTYLGDAIIGARVNVGAGSVTCNYDGVNKWPTHIEDGASIGAGSMLVAPVRIGADATIGAGSTITADAPQGELTLGRARQLTIPGWKRPTKRKI